MSALPTEINKARPSVAPMIVSITGRIEDVERYEGIFNTRLICAAVDQFSHPQTVKVRSKTRFGSKDEITTISARLGGYKRAKYSTKPNKDGEIFQVTPVDMTLDLVE